MDRQGIVVGIHGLENKPPLDEKRRWWKAAILEGLQRNCGFDGESLAFEFVYWADLRYDRPLSEEENHEPYRPEAGDGPFPRQAASEPSLSDTVLSRVYGGLDWVQTKTGVTPVDDVILKTRFDDLWHYHSETAFARQVRGRLCDVLERLAGQRILLVAHSMGSIIAYDALRMLERDAPSVRVEHFVTLGSPLGLAEVRLKIVAENGAARTPNNVGRWTNLADKGDLAAVVGELAEDFAANDRGVGIRDVGVVNGYRRPNGEANHHKSYGYLRTPEFSEIARAFADGSSEASDALGDPSGRGEPAGAMRARANGCPALAASLSPGDE